MKHWACSSRAVSGCLAACIVVAAFATAPAEAAQAGDAALSGRVTDATGAVIAGALVVAAAPDGASEGQATTDAGGVYRIGPLPAGPYTVIASYPGFTAAAAAVELAAGGEQTVSLELQVAPQAAGVTVHGEKVEQDLLETPTSVGVVDAVQLASREMWRVEDAFRQIANVNFAD